MFMLSALELATRICGVIISAMLLLLLRDSLLALNQSVSISSSLFMVKNRDSILDDE